jgi:hypothetical protein
MDKANADQRKIHVRYKSFDTPRKKNKAECRVECWKKGKRNTGKDVQPKLEKKLSLGETLLKLK